jgi:hypothetical protein
MPTQSEQEESNATTDRDYEQDDERDQRNLGEPDRKEG